MIFCGSSTRMMGQGETLTYPMIMVDSRSQDIYLENQLMIYPKIIYTKEIHIMKYLGSILIICRMEQVGIHTFSCPMVAFILKKQMLNILRTSRINWELVTLIINKQQMNICREEKKSSIIIKKKAFFQCSMIILLITNIEKPS